MRILGTFVGLLLLTACDPASTAGAGSSSPATSASGAAASSASAKTAPKSALPAERDAEAAKLVKAGAACKLESDDISLSCPERKAAGDYAHEHQNSAAVAATCAELLRDADPSVKLVAAHCIDSLTIKAKTPILGVLFDTLEAESNPKTQRAIAWSLARANALEVKLEDRALGLVNKLSKSPEGETTAGSVLDTLFPLFGDAKPPKEAQKIVLDAFGRKEGGLFIRACDLVKRVEDRAAACKAVADAVVADSKEYWRAVAAFNDLGPDCKSEAPAVLGVLLAHHEKGDVDAPQETERFGEVFELTPDARKDAATKLNAAAKKLEGSQAKDVAEAAAAFAKPWAPPKKD